MARLSPYSIKVAAIVQRNYGSAMRKFRMVFSAILLLSICSQGKALSGLQKVSCMSSDMHTPIWVREYFIDFQDHYQNVIVARELQRDNECALGLKNTIYLRECSAVQYEPISCF